jgi:subfamily B ATP-binding cassette protein MsbA
MFLILLYPLLLSMLSMNVFDKRKFAGMIFAIMLIKITQHVLIYFQRIGTLEYSLKFMDILKRKMYARIFSFDKMYFDNLNSGTVYHTVALMPIILRNDVLMNLPMIILNATMMLIYICVLTTISWPLTLLSLLAVPSFALITTGVIRRIKDTCNEFLDAQKRLFTQISNKVSMIPMIKAHCMERREEKSLSSYDKKNDEVTRRLLRLQFLIEPIHEILDMILIFVLLLTSALLITKGGMKEGAKYLIFFFILKHCSVAAKNTNQRISDIVKSTADARHILELFDDRGKYTVPDGSESYQGLRSEIVIQGLNFSYPKRAQVLNDIRLTLRAGESLAIVGPTGSGKSTLVQTLMRFYDVPENTILLNGKDIRSFTKESLREHIAYVSQETYLFDDTLRENVLYGQSESLGDDQIYSALKKVKLYDFVNNLPDGLDTIVGEKGIKLSGGEKQRLSIVKAILRKNADLLIMDEPTSAMDSITERQIQESIAEVIKNKTSIIVAHRFSTIMNVDRVVVLDHGKVIESGTPQELVAKKDEFYKLWKHQSIAV